MNSTNVQDKTLKDLKAELVARGMPVEQVEGYNTKGQVQAILDTLSATETVKKVDSLVEVETPIEKKQAERQWLDKATIMKHKLMAQPKVTYLIPLESGETVGKVEWRTDKNGEEYQFVVGGACETVQLNGFKWIIPKGEYTEIPRQVADELNVSYHITSSAGSKSSLDRIDPKTGRSIKEML